MVCVGADSDSAEVTSDGTSASLETDDDTVQPQPATDDTPAAADDDDDDDDDVDDAAVGVDSDDRSAARADRSGTELAGCSNKLLQSNMLLINITRDTSNYNSRLHTGHGK